LKVAKFGGTSLADAAQIEKVVNIVKADPCRRIVVVSAPGKRRPDDIKVTDMLIACAEAKCAGRDARDEAAAVVGRYASISREAGAEEGLVAWIADDLRRRLDSDRGNRNRYLDLVKAAGEDYSARMVAAIFRARGIKARYTSPVEAGLRVTEEYGNAMVLRDSYARLAELRDEKGVIVFPGFFGITPAGTIATFSRGGSDITGAVLAAAVKADVYENFTDVDGVFAADPRIVPDARPVSAMTYREMRELSYAGFAVFHDEAIEPVVRAGIPVNVRNTNRPEAPGTVIAPSKADKTGTVVGIAGADGFCTIFLEKYLMNREIGFGRKLLQILEEERISYEHAPSGIDNMSVILREKQFTEEIERRVLERIRTELNPDDVSVERGLALIMIVGEGMHYCIGMAARATGALAKAGVNIEMMNQGSSEISMMFGVKADDRVKAVRALYDAFFGNS